MPGGYAEFKSSSKDLIKSSQIGPGQITLEHLAPSLFLEIRSVGTHSHTGSKSRKVDIRNLDGYFGVSGFHIYSSDGTKRYQVTVDSATGLFVLTEV